MVVLDPQLSKNTSLSQLASYHPTFMEAKKMFTVMSPIDYKNYTVVVLADKEQGIAKQKTSLFVLNVFSNYICYSPAK